MPAKPVFHYLALILGAIFLCACAAPVVSPTATATVTATSPDPTAPPIPGERLPFEARYYRTDGFVQGITYPKVTTIQSQQEAQSYIDANKAIYQFNPNRAAAFTNALLGFDDAYFQDHVVVVILLEEGSGSIRNEVTAVVQTADCLQVLIRRTVPDEQTADMAQWHILVELGREGYAENKAEALIYGMMQHLLH